MTIALGLNTLNQQGVYERGLKKHRKNSVIDKLMGRMIKNDSIIRPRRVAAKSEQNRIINNGLPIFSVSDIDSKFNVSPYGYVSPKNRKVKTGSHGVQGKVIEELEHYCEKTTLHGLRYVGDTKLTYCERIFWFMAFTTAIGFATYYITNIYQKWVSSPVIISFSPFDAQLKDIPFPAITICNMNQAKKTEALKILADGNPKEQKLLDDVCNSNETHSDGDRTGYYWTNLRDFLIKVGNSCSDMLRVCKWSSNITNCDDLFNNDLTDEGLCCSFNRLPPSKIFRNQNEISLLNQTYPANVYDWSPETGFPLGVDLDNDLFIPRRPLGAGAHLGLSIVLDAQIDEYYCSSTSSVGFKIIMGNPIETPKMADYGTLLSPGVEARFSIKPSVREASANLKSVPLQKRQCYFADERKLAYYRTYTKRNCNLECQSNYTYEECKCIPYYLPRTKNVTACGRQDNVCASRAKENMELVTGSGRNCQCLPGCFEISFTESKSFGALSKKLLNFSMNSDDWNVNSSYFVKNAAVVHFFFPTSQFTKQIKAELYGFTEILSNVGGLLGLCMGFSFLSMVEILYFVTLKLFCKWVLKHNNKKKNKKNDTSTVESGYNAPYPFLK